MNYIYVVVDTFKFKFCHLLLCFPAYYVSLSSFPDFCGFIIFSFSLPLSSTVLEMMIIHGLPL